MTKQDILDYFNDINTVYNDSTRLDSLSNMIDEMLEIALEKENKYDLAIKALRIVEVIEAGFKRDSNLMMDSDDWEDIKEFVEKEAENESAKSR